MPQTLDAIDDAVERNFEIQPRILELTRIKDRRDPTVISRFVSCKSLTEVGQMISDADKPTNIRMRFRRGGAARQGRLRFGIVQVDLGSRELTKPCSYWTTLSIGCDPALLHQRRAHSNRNGALHASRFRALLTGHQPGTPIWERLTAHRQSISGRLQLGATERRSHP